MAGIEINFAGALIDGQASETRSGYRILGVRLRKFSMWHRMLLIAVQSPFVVPGPVRLWDIRNAVGICRLSYPDSNIRRPWLVPFLIYAWLILKCFLWPISIRKRKPGELTPVQKAVKKRLDAFLDYTAAYNFEPEFAVIHPENDKPPEMRGNAPDILEHIFELGAWRMTLKEAWNCPVGIANWLRPLIKRDKGADISFVTQKEKEFTAKLPPEYRHR